MIKFLLKIVCLISFSHFHAQEQGFSIPTPDRKLGFPVDHGNHPDFKIEWWYVTGHLFDKNQRRFGFESTFFRLAHIEQEGASTSRLFDNSHIYMAHMAISDLSEKKFYHEERFNREGWNAFSKTGDLDLRNGNWSLKRDEGNVLQLNGSIQSTCHFSLKLTPQKSHVIFGENGVSKKGSTLAAASYYITWPRLQCEGTLGLGAEEFSVSGSAWMDHEISSSQLGEDETGWDWVSVQFDDGRELMAYQLRLKEGGYSPFSTMVWIDQQGELFNQKPADFTWIPGGEWKSPLTGAIYPISPRFSTIDPQSKTKRRFRIAPLMEAQEMTGKLGGVPYWEGACDVIDEASGKTVGKAYLELAGYVEGLSKRLR